MKTNLFFIITLFFNLAKIMLFEEKSIPSTLYSKIGPENVLSLVNKTVTKNSFLLTLKSENQKNENYLKKLKEQFLTLEIFLISKTTIQFIFRDLNGEAFEMPKEEPFPFHKNEKDIKDYFNNGSIDYDFELSITESPFSFTIFRKSTNEDIFSTINMDIIFSKNYAEISTLIPSKNIFGFGERTTSFKIKSGIYTLYNMDTYAEIDDGRGVGKQRYGSHPMYLMREKSGNYHISYLRNSLPMDVIIDHDQSLLTYKIAGGILDFTFFMGDKNPETVTKMYHEFLGRYTMPPFWSFGFQQSRWGYKNLEMMEDVLSHYKSLNLPLDVIWNDIDYMIDYQSLTVDTDRFNLEDFKGMMKFYKKKYVLISEPTIGIRSKSFEFYKKGLELDIFIKNGQGDNLINRVWPGDCHFIDFFNPKSKIFWEDAMTALHKNLTYDGVWLDMNEIAAFEAGQVDQFDMKMSCGDHDPYPYIPGQEPLETKTLCPNAVHYNGLKHIQVHNYYPNMQAKRTHDFLEKLYPDQFPFILTRANAPGIGKYAAHWSGDNIGRFNFYEYSVTEVFNFNLFGAPMAGADICGFGDDTPEVLCSKWYQMGSLYPFSRSHAKLDSYRKEPYAMGHTLYQTTLKSLQFRYSILKYYYSVFMLNNGTGTIFRPLFFEFSDDEELLEDANIQNFFMIGSSMLVVPNFNDADFAYDTLAYFPEGDWYDLRDHKRVPKKSNKPEKISIENKLNEMPPVFLRSGKIIFTNDFNNVQSTEDLNNKFKLLVAFDSNNKISETKKSFSDGVLPGLTNYHSKNSVQNCMKNDCYIQINSEIDYATNELKLSFSQAKFYDSDYSNLEIEEIVVHGVNLNTSSPHKKEKSDIAYNTGRFLNSSLEKDYEIKIINDSCFSIKFFTSFKLNTEKLSLQFKLE